MKVEIITRHSVPNYGSLLQSYATQRTLEKMGYDAEIINYTKYEERYNNLANTLLQGKKWNNSFLLRNIYKAIQTPNYAKMYKIFEKYRKGFLKETEFEYGNSEELQKNIPNGDVYCSGSDQIWGKIGTESFDENYFLEFAKGRKCISYASSFGKTELTNELREKLPELLKKYSKVLVREDSAKQILKALKINNVSQVLDPTLLILKEEWLELSRKSKVDLKNKKYILIYQLHDNKEFNNFAKKFAKEKNMKLLRISTSFFHITRSGKLIYLPNQFDFLNYFNNAEYILTDSFHATVFSIIFNKKFLDIMPKNNTGTRIMSILKLFNIPNRILDKYDNYGKIDEKIDYEDVNRRIIVEREKSIKLFNDAIIS